MRLEGHSVRRVRADFEAVETTTSASGYEGRPRGVLPFGIMRRDGLERLVDANGNRAREGLRVLEDLARFVLDDSGLAGDLKAVRHETTAAISELGLRHLEARDAAGDVGTSIGTEAEYARPGVVAVAEAAVGRATEAIRSLEEISKILASDSTVPARLEATRYRVYDLGVAVTAGLARGGPAGWRVQVLLTESACRGDWRQVLEAVIAGGADAIQVREKAMEPAALLERTKAIIDQARPAGIPVIVNDRADVAAAAGADGVHLGQDDLPFESARRVVGSLAIVGGSAHDLTEAGRIAAAGCDYAGVGRFSDSETKPGAAEAGPDFVRAFVAAHAGLPHLVIGGINVSNIDAVVAAGGRGVAVCAAVCDADDPSEAVARLRLPLQHAVALDTSGTAVIS